MDAGATDIDIHLAGEDGLEEFYLRDNGEGITREHLEDCAKRYYTSKLSSYEEILQLTTYGFRGEALNSICSVASKVTMITKTEYDEYPILVEFNAQGMIVDQEELTPDHSLRNRARFLDGKESGTEVRVQELFSKFPVRLQQQKANAKKNLRNVSAASNRPVNVKPNRALK